MKKNAKQLLILCIILAVCAGGYAFLSIYSTGQQSKKDAEAKAAKVYAGTMGAPVKLSYTANGKSFSFELNSNKWSLSGSPDFPLNQATVTALASTLQGLTADRTFDAPSDLSPYGLDKPAYTVTASDASGKTFKLLFGSTNGDDCYAMADGNSKINTVSSSILSSLKTDQLSLVALDAIPVLSESSLSTLTLSSGGKTLTLDRHKEKDGSYTWYVKEGKNATAADSYTIPDSSGSTATKYITDIVTGLSSASFSSCAAWKPSASNLSAYGLNAPLTLTVDYIPASQASQAGLPSAADAKTLVLEIGAPTSDAASYYARVKDSQQVDLLPAASATPLYTAVAALGTAG